MRIHSTDCAVGRCLSVSLSVTDVVSLLITDDILSTPLNISSNCFSPLGSTTILFFSYQTGWQYPDGNPPNGGAQCKGVWKNHDFRPISRFVSEMMQDGDWETAPKLSNDTSLNNLEWPLTHISRSRYYSTLNNSKRYKWILSLTLKSVAAKCVYTDLHYAKCIFVAFSRFK